MVDKSGETANPEPKRRGPKSKAEIEAEVRASLEAEVRAQMEADLAERLEAARQEGRQEAEAAKAEASDATPVNGSDLSDDPSSAEAVVFHFVEDGFTLWGKVWYRGEEAAAVPGSENWDSAMTSVGAKGNFTGEVKPAFLFDEYEQEEKWGRRYMRLGPWRGKRLDEVDSSELTEAERLQLERAQKKRDQQFGAVPH